MRVAATRSELDAALGRTERGSEVGLVPTMGSLHDGHLSLINTAASECDAVVVSVFVNPAQFDETRDLDAYPRDLDTDAALAAEAGANVVFAPTVEAMYPGGFETWVELTETTKPMEGEARPGHFRGVATVCLKLFNLVSPDIVYFGLKDAQQTAVIARMIRDLDLALIMRLGETVRDPDGLALSSRNARLSPEERERALALPRALASGVAAHRAGDNAIEAASEVLAAETEIKTDYVESLTAHGHELLCAAIRIGSIRLIDNMILEEPA